MNMIARPMLVHAVIAKTILFWRIVHKGKIS